MSHLEHASADFKNVWFGELWPLLMGHPKVRQSYPDEASAELGGEMYCAVLADLRIDRLRGAVLQCLATSDWFPTPAELRRAVGVLDGERPVVTLEAFGAVMREVSAALVECRKPRLGDRIALEVIRDLGGAFTCVNQKPENLYPRFRDAYAEKQRLAREEASIVPVARELAGAPESVALPGSNVRAFPAPADDQTRADVAERVAQIRARVGPAPEGETRPLDRHEAAALVAKARELAPTADVPRMPEPPAEEPPVEPVAFATCPCGFEYPSTYDQCPKCRFKAQTQAS